MNKKPCQLWVEKMFGFLVGLCSIKIIRTFISGWGRVFFDTIRRTAAAAAGRQSNSQKWCASLLPGSFSGGSENWCLLSGWSPSPPLPTSSHILPPSPKCCLKTQVSYLLLTYFLVDTNDLIHHQTSKNHHSFLFCLLQVSLLERRATFVDHIKLRKGETFCLLDKRHHFQILHRLGALQECLIKIQSVNLQYPTGVMSGPSVTS